MTTTSRNGRGAALASPAAAGAPSSDLQPQTLTRGPDIAVPHIEDGYFVETGRSTDGSATLAYGEVGVPVDVDALLG